jgi:RNA ligase (TIGR02306 family)
MSAHSVRVIEISEVRPHGNAERLEIVPVNGWQAVVKKGQFKPGDRAVYIEPDYTIPTAREEFAFLAKEGRERHRLKAVRLRGVLSFGLLIPPPADVADRAVGDDVMADLGIERYAPPVKFASSDELPQDRWPTVYTPVFDVENFQKFPDMFSAGEPVFVTEKIHGANARYLFHNGVFYMGSRTRWLKPDVAHIWNLAVLDRPEILNWCRINEGVVLYGEVYGRVQSLKYGRPNRVSFAAFAGLRADEWLSLGKLLADLQSMGVPTAPILYAGPFDQEKIAALAEEDSAVSNAGAGHMREGVVIVPDPERRDENIGRVALKLISNRYWESEA